MDLERIAIRSKQEAARLESGTDSTSTIDREVAKRTRTPHVERGGLCGRLVLEDELRMEAIAAGFKKEDLRELVDLLLDLRGCPELTAAEVRERVYALIRQKVSRYRSGSAAA